MPEPSPLLLVGCQRSGTTALAHALSAAFAAAGGCFTVNGKLFYLAGRWLRPDDLAARHLRADELLHALDRRPAGGVGAGGWRERVERALRAAAARAAAGQFDPDGEGALRLVRELAATAYGGGPWGDKYNEYLLDLPYLHRLYPRARWLFLYRHPAEVVASMLAWTGDRPWRPADESAAEAKWADWNRRWLEFRSRLHPEQRLEISYDDVCTDAGIDAVRRFTGLEVGYDAMVRHAGTPRHAPRHAHAAAVWARLETLHRAHGPVPQRR